MKNFIKKKDRGSIIDSMFAPVLGAIAMALVVVIFANFMANIDRKNDVEQVARKYILIMETDGYLGSTDETALRQELAALGVSSIDLSGTTFTEVGYGEPVTLEIDGEMAIRSLGVGNGLSFRNDADTIDIHIEKTSTAKH